MECGVELIGVWSGTSRSAEWNYSECRVELDEVWSGTRWSAEWN